MALLNFKFSKPWYLQSDVIDVLSISNSRLKRYMTEVLSSGGDLADMGYLKFLGCKEACWNPVKLMQWVLENKLEKTPVYDYEVADQKRAQMQVINLQQKQQQKKEAV